MKILFSKFAKNELDDAVTFYETELAGLGRLFKEEIKSSVSRIKEHPEAWSIEKGDVRKALLHRFPYKILYSIEKDHIVILAIAHQHRKPNYWV
ncbi:MAG: type II toxin-antitoxin system RelE/ParE family toxin [Ignavibacteriales bacterium]|jgi:plasmid stabilization system protein ParE|nr:type II toxin-antitoxin system RelE/ParE family toxin [Ignavibacteriales bacterium]